MFKVFTCVERTERLGKSALVLLKIYTVEATVIFSLKTFWRGTTNVHS